MMKLSDYKILIDKKAQKYLEKLNNADYTKLVEKIKSLTSSNLKLLNIKKLQGYKNLYRIRVDDYRVIFVVISDRKMIIIPIIGHRKDVYDLVKRLQIGY